MGLGLWCFLQINRLIYVEFKINSAKDAAAAICGACLRRRIRIHPCYKVHNELRLWRSATGPLQCYQLSIKLLGFGTGVSKIYDQHRDNSPSAMVLSGITVATC